MRTITKNLLAASMLAVLGTSGAEASIIGPDAAGGSEAILTLINSATSQTVAQDLGVQWGQVTATSYALSSTLQNFITAAGGVGSANLTFAVIAGGNARTYLASSQDADFDVNSVNNAERSPWLATITAYTNALNTGDASATNVNNSYGPFTAAAEDAYYVGANQAYDVWKGITNNVSAPTSSTTLLYKVLFGIDDGENATVTGLLGPDTLATLSGSQLTISASAVPLPAGVWLLGSGLGMLGTWRRFRNNRRA